MILYIYYATNATCALGSLPRGTSSIPDGIRYSDEHAYIMQDSNGGGVVIINQFDPAVSSSPMTAA